MATSQTESPIYTGLVIIHLSSTSTDFERMLWESGGGRHSYYRSVILECDTILDTVYGAFVAILAFIVSERCNAWFFQDYPASLHLVQVISFLLPCAGVKDSLQW